MTTAIFATCGMPVTTFLIAAFLALPKQFATVYLGYAENLSADGSKSKGVTIAKIAVITVTVVVTIYAMRYVNARIDAIKARVVYERRKARCVFPSARARTRRARADGLVFPSAGRRSSQQRA